MNVRVLRGDDLGQAVAAVEPVGLSGRDVAELTGLLHGMLADDSINDREALFLSTWLRNRPSALTGWPGADLFALCERMLNCPADGAEVGAELRELIGRIIGGRVVETGACGGVVTQVVFDDLKTLPTPGATICLTGTFVGVSRRELEERLSGLGYRIAKNSLGSSVEMLVVGAAASKDWVSSSYGRKIEAALSRRKKPGKPMIVAEKQLLSLLSAVRDQL
jgi:hypothetical protein